MSDEPPPSSSVPTPDNPLSAPPEPARESGCALVGGAIAGFGLFLSVGWVALMLGRNGVFGISYLVVAAGVAIWLATRPGFRGLAIGIFLGLGATLLLIAMCSGMKI